MISLCIPCFVRLMSREGRIWPVTGIRGKDRFGQSQLHGKVFPSSLHLGFAPSFVPPFSEVIHILRFFSSDLASVWKSDPSSTQPLKPSASPSCSSAYCLCCLALSISKNFPPLASV